MDTRIENLHQKSTDIVDTKSELTEKSKINAIDQKAIRELLNGFLADEGDVTQVRDLQKSLEADASDLEEKNQENESQRSEALSDVDSYIQSLEANLDKLQEINATSDLVKNVTRVDSTKQRLDRLENIKAMLEGEQKVYSVQESLESSNVLHSDFGKEFREQYQVKNIESVQHDYVLGILITNTNLSQNYKTILKERYNSAENMAKNVFDIAVRSKRISVADGAWKGSAHYYPIDNERKRGIYYNASADENNLKRKGKGTTFYHEVGHMIDHAFGGDKYLSSSETFYNALMKDAEAIKTKFYSSQEWANKFLDLIETDATAHSISDIMEGLTNGEISGAYGHIRGSYNYWSVDKFRICNESFAHFFEASMGGGKVNSRQTKIERLRVCFPNALQEFEHILSSIDSSSDVFSRMLEREK